MRIVTRESPLAMWQARHVADALGRAHPRLNVEITGVSTEADVFTDRPLHSLGGKGAFVKELEQALLEGRADLAVHSMKDVVVELPAGLAIAAVLPRENPRDAFVSNNYDSLDEIPAGGVVGTSSMRRACQLRANYPGLEVKNIRGNVGSRLRKLDAGGFDALILACAGLKRLGHAQRITGELAADQMLPAIGQGALGIEIREGDDRTRELVGILNDAETMLCVTAERMVNRRLNGGCLAPIAAHAVISHHVVAITALVGSPDGAEIIRSGIAGPEEKAAELGDKLGLMLLDKGAERILEDIRVDELP